MQSDYDFSDGERGKYIERITGKAFEQYWVDWPNGLFICPLVNNYDRRLHEFLWLRNFEQGSSLFHGESEIDIQNFRNLNENHLAETSNSVIHRIFIHWVQRVRNFQHLLTLAAAEIENAKTPQADYLTDTNCIAHAGRLINVNESMKRLSWIMGLTHEEYEIQAYGIDFGFPPFDLMCSCTMEGVFEGVNDYYVVPKRRITRTKWDRLNHIHFILSKHSPSEMSDEKFRELLSLMLRVSDELIDNPDPRAKLERTIGEAFVARKLESRAIPHLEKALTLRPKVGVKKLLNDLKSRNN